VQLGPRNVHTDLTPRTHISQHVTVRRVGTRLCQHTARAVLPAQICLSNRDV